MPRNPKSKPAQNPNLGVMSGGGAPGGGYGRDRAASGAQTADPGSFQTYDALNRPTSMGTGMGEMETPAGPMTRLPPGGVEGQGMWDMGGGPVSGDQMAGGAPARRGPPGAGGAQYQDFPGQNIGGEMQYDAYGNMQVRNPMTGGQFQTVTARGGGVPMGNSPWDQSLQQPAVGNAGLGAYGGLGGLGMAAGAMSPAGRPGWGPSAPTSGIGTAFSAAAPRPAGAIRPRPGQANPNAQLAMMLSQAAGRGNKQMYNQLLMMNRQRQMMIRRAAQQQQTRRNTSSPQMAMASMGLGMLGYGNVGGGRRR